MTWAGHRGRKPDGRVVVSGRRLRNPVARGAISGLVGTAAMTAVMAAARAGGTLAGELPPRQVARRAEEAVGVRDRLSKPGFEARWLAQHFAYGTAAGVAYALIERRLAPNHPLVAGLLYGLALWTAGYAGWVPAMGLAPWPGEQPKRRVASEIATHLVYGGVTAWTSRRL